MFNLDIGGGKVLFLLSLRNSSGFVANAAPQKPEQTANDFSLHIFKLL
jgi:hypothetical protein